jgi:mRNA interferase MazF
MLTWVFTSSSKTLEISGVVLADQIKNLDWQARNARLALKAPPEVTNEVLAKIKVLLE